MWDKIFPGDEVIYSASRENAISEMLNQFPDLENLDTSEPLQNSIRLRCYARTDIDHGQAVKLLQYHNEYEAVEIQAKPKETDFLGITANKCAADTREQVIVFGQAEAYVTMEKKSHSFAKLKEGELISCDDKTTCRILSTQDDETGKQLCTVFLGTPQSTTAPEIHTDFAVTLEEDNTLSITGGYLNRNGTLLSIEGKKQITPQNGTLCLRSVMEEKTEGSQWTAPEFVFCEVACNAWPVADVTVTENEDGTKKISIRQRITNVAIILQTKPCPLTTVGALKQ